MCGIFGGHPSRLVNGPSTVIGHRGPDQEGVCILKDGVGRDFLFGMTRLSIVDKTPMSIPFDSDGYVIVFNGEIYNWREIRSELEKRGYQFKTNTDTEVVLHAYREYGAACLSKFNGMFAIAIWHESKLFLARDRVGKKPLFFSKSASSFAFSSEIKVFSGLTFDPVPLCEKLEFYCNEHTPYKKVHSLKPGEWLIWDSHTNKVESRKWWIFPRYSGCISDEKSALEEFLSLFHNACDIRRVADVPVTLFLSGGIDSSLIQAMVRLPTTITVQFDEYKTTINERKFTLEYSKAFNFENRVITPTKQDFQAVLGKLARHIEYPVGSFSIYPLYCLGRAAAEAGFKVALSGEGADELFNGYVRNEILIEEHSRVEEYLKGDYRHLSKRYFGSNLERFTKMASRHGPFNDQEIIDFFDSYWHHHDPMHHNISVVEASVFLQPLLVMADRMSMANSIEVRNPFLDYRVIEFSAKLAPSLRYRDGRGKYLLRRALKELTGHRELGITTRQIKHGLPAPINQWMLNKDGFDRAAWNQMVISECLKQL